MQTLKVTFDCELPVLPNFLRSPQGQTIDVADCTDDGLRELGQKWTDALIEHAGRRRNRLKVLP
jgi:hypothetical protein